jgi:hypothetical protein
MKMKMKTKMCRPNNTMIPDSRLTRMMHLTLLMKCPSFKALLEKQQLYSRNQLLNHATLTAEDTATGSDRIYTSARNQQKTIKTARGTANMSLVHAKPPLPKR